MLGRDGEMTDDLILHATEEKHVKTPFLIIESEDPPMQILIVLKEFNTIESIDIRLCRSGMMTVQMGVPSVVDGSGDVDAYQRTDVGLQSFESRPRLRTISAQVHRARRHLDADE